MSLKGLIAQQWQRQEHCVRRIGTAVDWTAGANFNIFNLAGFVIIHQIFGHVTTLMGVGAAVPLIQHTPTGSAAAVPITGAAGTIAGDVVDTIYVNVAGALATALTPGPAIGLVDTAGTAWDGAKILAAPGIISIVNAVACNAGVVDWYILYTPASPNAIVTAL